MAAAFDEDALRGEVRSWLAGAWDPDLALVEWRSRLVEAGWARPSWPSGLGGRGLPPAAEGVVEDELARAGAVELPVGGGVGLAAPTILAHGTDEQQRRFIPRTLTGEDTWCQLFSEPGSGSDLAGLSTTAVRDGDEFVVDGQKVWTTSAHHADLGMLLARTDWDAPKHRGITWFAFPMHQDGVDVRPLRQMNGKASFNEVFLTGARVPAANALGAVGDGWSVALTTLAHERRFGGMGGVRFDRVAPGRCRDEAEAEAAEWARTYDWYPQRAGRPDLLVEAARSAGLGDDPLVRQSVAGVHALVSAHRWTAQRAAAARAAGRQPGPEGSLGKLGLSDVARASAGAHSSIAGTAGLLPGVVAEILTSVPAQSIAGGTDQIQRNIIGERALGLLREPSDDRDRPYREVRRNG